MDVTSRRISDALKTAIRREERTAATYTEKAKKAKHPSAKKVLEILAKQEIGHAKKLSLIMNKGLDVTRLGKSSRAQATALHVLNDDVRKIERSNEVVTVLQKAVEAEANSARLYRSLEKIFKGAEVEILFGKLAEEEDKHQARLESTLAKL